MSTQTLRITKDFLADSDGSAPPKLERGTGFEPATTSLEGWCSATELPPRVLVVLKLLPSQHGIPTLRLSRGRPQDKSEWWAGRDSNPRRREPTDLQSAPFGRLGTCPFQGTRPWAIAANSLRRLPNARRLLMLELAVGLAPTTACLQNRCSTVELRQPVCSAAACRAILGTGTGTVKRKAAPPPPMADSAPSSSSPKASRPRLQCPPPLAADFGRIPLDSGVQDCRRR